MRKQAVMLALAVASAPAAAQDERPRTAEEFIEHAREAYAVTPPEPEPEPCPEASAAEIVVCRQYRELEEVPGILSPSEQALEDGKPPPDRIPGAQHMFDPPPCIPSLLSLCLDIRNAIGATPMIDFAALPEPLTPEDLAHIVRAEDAPGSAAASAATVP